MPARILITGGSRESLASGWELASTPPGSVDHPKSAASLHWTAIEGLGTVASALRANGTWSLDGPARRFDAEDWWYRKRFTAAPAEGTGNQTVLGLEGLATIADVWLNGEQILSSDNMFVAHEIPIDAWLATDNELTLRFRSLDAALAARRPRPRWRTPMIENQQLRWFRTTLLGRTPGWSPPAAAVGPWRPIWIETRRQFSVADLAVSTSVHGTTGVVDVVCEIVPIGRAAVPRTSVVVSRLGQRHTVALEPQKGADHRYTGRLEVPHATLWWPHTHGEPALYEARLIINGVESDIGRIGFRTVTLDSSSDDFALSVNGVRIFCRGACWTPLDCVALDAPAAHYDAAVAQVASAGMNMLRVGGTMAYEADAFLDACDTQGVLLWQDFMFANMDYPEGDSAFEASVKRESEQVLRRLSGRPSLAVLCGNSEGEQQAAMWGAPPERWQPPLFHQLLREQASMFAPGVPYWPSSAHGGAFPHQGNVGTTSYYGVGAYRRPLTDARRAEVRFATECLAFANVPEEETLAKVPGGAVKVHSAQWKQRSPRDLGAGWDFDDVRDHYLREVFGVDPLDLRYANHERYLELSRAVSGEVMAATFREWRRKRSTCNGGLIWFLRDLWPGAGWGIIGADGIPKAPYYHLRRALQLQTISLSDEGGNGLFVHVTNDSAELLQAEVELSLYRNGEVSVASHRSGVTVPSRSAVEVPAAAGMEGFFDLSYAYRFGPPAQDLVVATLRDVNAAVVSQDFYLPLGHKDATERDIGLVAKARLLDADSAELSIQTQGFAQSVTVRVDGFSADDQYFHLAPGAKRTIRLRRVKPTSSLKGTVHALNARSACKIAITE